VTFVDRNALAGSGPVFADVWAREIPLGGSTGRSGLHGLSIALTDGDKAPACTVEQDWRCDGGGFDLYTLEVVDRMGTDSFTPDAGVLVAKTKDQDNAPFEWVVDANPQDIGMTDYVLPDGTAVPITIGDYRQLSDALFHAGTNSGSEYEYVDEANRLHFYVLDVKRDKKGVLSYTVAIKSLDGPGPQRRGVKVLPTYGLPNRAGLATCEFPVFNTGRAAVAGTHPEDVTQYLNGDVYRVSATVDGRGWTVDVPNALATAKFGQYVHVPVYAKKSGSGSHVANVRLTATSESDPSKKATATCVVVGR
jgi:hypothetical protein